MAIDEQKMEEAVGKVFGELAVAVTGPLVVLGDRLGLWAALAGAGPMTPNELASRTGTVERYVREWLRGVAVAGYVGYDPAPTRSPCPTRWPWCWPPTTAPRR